nr:hypothetical protein [uncultured Cohaesibacter sp.]
MIESATFSTQDHLNDVRLNEAEIDWLMIAVRRNPLVFTAPFAARPRDGALLRVRTVQ